MAYGPGERPTPGDVPGVGGSYGIGDEAGRTCILAARSDARSAADVQAHSRRTATGRLRPGHTAGGAPRNPAWSAASSTRVIRAMIAVMAARARRSSAWRSIALGSSPDPAIISAQFRRWPE